MEEENGRSSAFGLVAKLEALNLNINGGTETTKQQQRFRANQAAHQNSFKPLTDVLLSWSLEDIFNKHLFKVLLSSFILFSNLILMEWSEDLNFRLFPCFHLKLSWR